MSSRVLRWGFEGLGSFSCVASDKVKVFIRSLDLSWRLVKPESFSSESKRYWLPVELLGLFFQMVLTLCGPIVSILSADVDYV